MPICPRGFWSNHSTTKERRYCSVSSNLTSAPAKAFSLPGRPEVLIVHRVREVYHDKHVSY